MTTKAREVDMSQYDSYYDDALQDVRSWKIHTQALKI